MIDLSPRRVALGALLGLGLTSLTVAPALAQAADGSHGPVAHHARKKKGKKKGGPQVIVHCASVGVTCKGTPGPAGPQGPAGTPGAAGVNGATVILRARGGGVQLPGKSSSCGSLICGENIPLTPNIWTQGATEDNQFVGSATIQVPSETACGYEESSKLKPDQVILVAEIDGKIEGLTEIEGGSGETTVVAPIVFDLGIESLEGASEGIGPGFFLGSGASQTHVLTVLGEDACATAAHAKVTSLAIDVLGTS
jgi:hypothetical protein